MSVANQARSRIDSDRWLRPIVVLLAIAAGYFGIVPLVVPELGAQLSGLAGQDIFIYRLAGAASFGYTIGLAVGWADGWRGLWIPIAGMAVFAVGSIVACLAAILGAEATWLAYVVLVASSVFLVLHIVLLTNPPSRGGPALPAEPDVADQVLWVIGFGTVAAIGTGTMALVLGGGMGQLLGGYSGTDPFVYRQAGAATLGLAMTGLLALRSRRWVEIRGGLAGAFAFNALAFVAVLIELAGGGVNLFSTVVLGVSLIVSVGLGLALRRGGR